MKHQSVKTLNDIKERCYITPDGQWIWKGALSHGKPVVWYNGKTAQARRVAYMLKYNKTEVDMAGLFVWTGTEDPRDINPATANVGTRSDLDKWRCAKDPLHAIRTKAMFDKIRKQNQRQYTPEEIAEICASPLSEKREALKWGCHPSTIGRIRRGQCRVRTQVTGASVFTWKAAA